ncbi:predicted protein [Nematostella vectensis]|uniref:G-protein coupled receptors family 1 profile domain-containing protein n=1 Tax=Nematostella vectensis TaxID=45351 RepID=A7RYZ7_NEMVE|nr:predicted protein [Nematostella vectensis]|eukprot:XP_001635378.1 predicted protein [Nematostella vectensis]
MKILSKTDARFIELQVQLASRGTARLLIETLGYGSLTLMGLLGNIVVLKIIHNKKGDGRVIYLFLGALAVSDILLLGVSAVLGPTVLAMGKWPFSDDVCQFQGFYSVFLASVSLLLLAVMAVNRYFRVVCTNYYRLLFTPLRTKLYICGTWLLASVAPVQYLASGERYSFSPGKCFYFQKSSNHQPSTLFAYVNVFIPMCVIIFCYYKIFNTIRSHQIQANIQQNNNFLSRPNIQEIKVTRTLFLTVVGFMLCWTAVLVIDLFDMVLDKLSFPREMYIFYSWLVTISSVINPFIYGVMNPMFREEFKRILRIKCNFPRIEPVQEYAGMSIWLSVCQTSQENMQDCLSGFSSVQQVKRICGNVCLAYSLSIKSREYAGMSGWLSVRPTSQENMRECLSGCPPVHQVKRICGNGCLAVRPPNKSREYAEMSVWLFVRPTSQENSGNVCLALRPSNKSREYAGMSVWLSVRPTSQENMREGLSGCPSAQQVKRICRNVYLAVRLSNKSREYAGNVCLAFHLSNKSREYAGMSVWLTSVQQVKRICGNVWLAVRPSNKSREYAGMPVWLSIRPTSQENMREGLSGCPSAQQVKRICGNVCLAVRPSNKSREYAGRSVWLSVRPTSQENMREGLSGCPFLARQS